ncbi:hypothetical protein CDAR_607651 [Caerostris darwini]|uniref:Uncharacterized protein n=1 Tax=Caerostris darwini TaxID=1538125 RepID=A0AAV4UL20_9ARAC|nr:hypothetical protein CDAR_607651 [Caerostris darwini]
MLLKKEMYHIKCSITFSEIDIQTLLNLHAHLQFVELSYLKTSHPSFISKKENKQITNESPHEINERTVVRPGFVAREEPVNASIGTKIYNRNSERAIHQGPSSPNPRRS